MQGTIKSIITLAAGLLVLTVCGSAFAEGAAANAQTVEAAKWGASAWIALAAGLCLGLAAFGGALGQGKAASAALDGIARNPGAQDKVFTPFILALALIESLVIYALIIAILLYGKIGA